MLVLMLPSADRSLFPGNHPWQMLRLPHGTRHRVFYNGATAWTFLPARLPPDPPVAWSRRTARSFDAAMLALGRLESVETRYLPFDLKQALIQREAIVSLAIEGSDLSLEQLIMHQSGHPTAPHVPNIVNRARNAVAAVESGLQAVDEGQESSTELLKRFHKLLVAEPRLREYGIRKHQGVPGELREEWLWPGGLIRESRPNMRTLPEDLPACMAELDAFLRDDPSGTPGLLKAALAHAQLDFLHPFVDEFPRTNLLFTSVLMKHSGLAEGPPLQFSEHVRDNLMAYRAALDEVRLTGDWHAWLEFFFGAVGSAAGRTAALYEEVKDRLDRDQSPDTPTGRYATTTEAVLRVMQREMLSRPVLSVAELEAGTGAAASSVRRALSELRAYGIVRELTGLSRNRLYRYEPVIHVLTRGTARSASGLLKWPTTARGP